MVLNEAVAYWTSLQQSGDIESWEPFALAAHGGDLAGFAILRGDPAKLAQVRISSEFQRVGARAQYAVQNFGIVSGVTGEELQRLFGMLLAQVQELSGRSGQQGTEGS